jgi:hypothetical protein
MHPTCNFILGDSGAMRNYFFALHKNNLQPASRYAQGGEPQKSLPRQLALPFFCVHYVSRDDAYGHGPRQHFCRATGGEAAVGSIHAISRQENAIFPQQGSHIGPEQNEPDRRSDARAPHDPSAPASFIQLSNIRWSDRA